MTMMTFAAVFVILWISQMLLMWWQAKRFMVAVAELRAHGDVVTGRYRRRGLRTYAAIAVKDGRVSGSQILKGYTVFARATPDPLLLGASVEEVAEGLVSELRPRTAAAAAHAAQLYLEHYKQASETSIPG